MSERSKDGGKEYTVDEILAEFDHKQEPEADTAKQGNDITETLNTETPDAPEENADDETEINEVTEPVFESKPESVISGITPADTFGAKAEHLTPEELFSPETEETEETEKEDVIETAAELADEAMTEWNDIAVIPDEEAFPEPQELEEDIVPEEEREAALAADTPNEDPEIISDEEEEDAEPAEDDTPEEQEKTAEGAPESVTSDDKGGEAPQENDQAEKRSFIQGIIPWKGDSVFEIIRKIIFIAAVVVFIGAGIMLISTLVQSSRAVSDLADIKEVVTTTAVTTIDSDGNVITVAPTEEDELRHNLDVMKYYKDISEDVVGFIELEGCDIYQPVVQGEDNEYYLKHTYYGESNKGGAIFADYRCRIEDDYMSPNIVLYGHNQEDGTMFGNLKEYKQNLEFYAANPTVTFRTEAGVGTYLIYGFFVTNALANQDSNGEVFHYHDYIEVMNDESTFNWYLGEVQRRNQIISPVDVEFGDQLLCLSTCSNEFSNSRFVVFARKLREGESVSDYDFSETYFNPNAKGVDWDAILSGETTTAAEDETSDEEEEETSEEEPEEETEEVTEETTLVPETEETTTTPETTEETSKTKRVDRTKTSYVHTTSTWGTTAETEATTEVPETEESDTTTETGGVSQTENQS
ncbi:MAG: class B sortase [Oscillospiraceae bacterium]